MIERGLTLVGPLALLGLWETLSRGGWLNAIFFPPPSTIVGTLVALLASGELIDHTRVSALRILVGFVAAAVPAIGLGMVMGLVRPVRLLLMPAAAALYPIPKIAVLPLVMLILGLGESSKIAIVVISVFFLVLVNTVAGVLAISPLYFDVGRTFGARRLDLYRTVALPGALPFIMAGCRLAMGFAITVIVGAEFLGSQDGIGALIWRSYQTFNLETMYAGLIVTALLGWLANQALEEVEQLLVPWQREAGRA